MCMYVCMYVYNMCVHVCVCSCVYVYCRRRRDNDENSYVLRTNDLTYGRTLSYPYTDKVFMDFSVVNNNTEVDGESAIFIVKEYHNIYGLCLDFRSHELILGVLSSKSIHLCIGITYVTWSPAQCILISLTSNFL